MKTFISDLSQKEFPITQRITGSSIRPMLMEQIQKEHPGFDSTMLLANSELNDYRQKFIDNRLQQELGDLNEMEKLVLESLKEESTLTDKIESEEFQTRSYGQVIADKVATFGGSWTFIIIFAVFILIWTSANIVFLANKGFDPYPFILLNLILSCIAAMQAPVIMMSQNRQEEKDRDRAKKDYMINLKSELEIRVLHEKIDHLIMHQQQELMEIQRFQIDMMNDILERLEGKTSPGK